MEGRDARGTTIVAEWCEGVCLGASSNVQYDSNQR